MIAITGQVTLVELNGNETDFKRLQEWAKAHGGYYVGAKKGLYGYGFQFRKAVDAEAFVREVHDATTHPEKGT